MKIAIIGAGNMGAAIARGILANTEGNVVAVSNPSQGKLDSLREEFPLVQTSNSNIEVVKGADVVILAVKPWKMQGVINEILPYLLLKRQMLVSIAGGVSLEDFDSMFPPSLSKGPAFHVIPDTAILVNRGITFISHSRASEEQVKAIAGLFRSMGEVAVIEERLMPAATALTSCGIAYAYKFVQACVQAGVQLGFYPGEALRYVNATVDGAIAMLRANGTLPQQEIDRVTTPGGLTIKGINSLEQTGFTASVITAILAAISK